MTITRGGMLHRIMNAAITITTGVAIRVTVGQRLRNESRASMERYLSSPDLPLAKGELGARKRERNGPSTQRL